MDAETVPGAGWTVTGFQVVVFLGAWASVALLHVVWRSLLGPETDALRPSGPLD